MMGACCCTFLFLCRVGRSWSCTYSAGAGPLRASESRSFGVFGQLNVGIFGGTLRFGTTNRFSARAHAYIVDVEVAAGAASFVYGGSLKPNVAVITNAVAAVVSLAGTLLGPTEAWALRQISSCCSAAALAHHSLLARASAASTCWCVGFDSHFVSCDTVA